MGIIRNLHLLPKNIIYQSCRAIQIKAKEEKICLEAVNQAEKIVGYPTSFLSLRWLLNDEVANIALHIRKLIGTNHPLLNTARELLFKNEVPAWGLIVLLVSKMGGLKSNFDKVDQDITAGILHSQRVLAEVTEMIRTSNIIHNSLINIDTECSEKSDLYFGNKLALLSGDFLLSSSFRELAGLKNTAVNELISTCLRDLVEAQFIGRRDKQNRPIPEKPLSIQKDIDIPYEFGAKPFKFLNVLGNTKSEWILRHLLGGASLLAKCCQGTLILANHSKETQELGYILGRNMALAWQARLDLQEISPENQGPLSLISAPVMFHLKSNPEFYNEICNKENDLDKINYEKIRKEVQNGPGIEETVVLKREFCKNGLEVLGKFPNGDAKEALGNMIHAM